MYKRWALVTGADRGVGLELVKALLLRGYHVFAGQLIDNNEALDGLALTYGEQYTLSH